MASTARNFGTRHLLRGHPRRAAAFLAHAVMTSPTDAIARHNLAIALRALGDRHAALEQAEAALSLSETAEGFALVGNLRLLCGDTARAALAFRQAARRNHGPGWYQLGVLLWSQGSLLEAQRALTAALSTPLPDLLRVRIVGQLVDLRRGDPVDAMNLCTIPLISEVLPRPTLSSQPTPIPAGQSQRINAAQVAERLHHAEYVVALTGAGISEASGLETRKQLWQRFDRDEAVSVWRFHEDPAYLWRVIADFLGDTEPNPNAAHLTLAALPVAAVVTQNVDALHQRAGSPEVIELHGAMNRTLCHRCQRKTSKTARQLLDGPQPPRCVCGGPLRPDVVLFGETVSPAAMQAALDHIRRADVLLVVGCAMDVAPASELPRIAAHHGAQIIELNRTPSRLTRTLPTWLLPGPAEETLPEVYTHLRKRGG